MDQKTFTDLVQRWEAKSVRAALAAKPAFATMTAANGMTPLHRCCRVSLPKSGLRAVDSIATVRALLDAGAEVSKVRIILDDGEEFRATPLWYAVAWGQNFPLAKFLLEQGSDPNHCLFASTWAQDPKLTKLLLDAGAEIDPVAFGETPLMMILKVNRPACAQLLIDHGADINYRDPTGFTILHHAVKKKFTQKQVRALLDLSADSTIENAEGETASALATRLGQPGLAKLLA
jgi:ankyrin repeat protein